LHLAKREGVFDTGREVLVQQEKAEFTEGKKTFEGETFFSRITWKGRACPVYLNTTGKGIHIPGRKGKKKD